MKCEQKLNFSICKAKNQFSCDRLVDLFYNITQYNWAKPKILLMGARDGLLK